jgi:hypothetical protein
MMHCEFTRICPASKVEDIMKLAMDQPARASTFVMHCSAFRRTANCRRIGSDKT